MPITWRCSCGKLLKAKDEFIGRQAPCPACKKVHTVPSGEKPAEPHDEIFDADPVDEEPQEEILDALPVHEPAGPKSAGIATKRVGNKDEADSHESIEVDRAPPRRPRVSRRKRRRGPIIDDNSEESDMFELQRGWYGNVYGGVIGGVLMIFMAFGLFIAGSLLRGICCGLPIALPILSVILFVTGVAAIIMGLINKK
jgi:hypothetical protein